MSEWWHRLWDDPLSSNGWALGAVLAVGLALFGPVLFMMGRQMLRRRKQDTEMSDDRPPEAAPDPPAAVDDERDPQADVREVAMSAPDPDRAPRLVAVPALRPTTLLDAGQTEQWSAQGTAAVRTHPIPFRNGVGSAPAQPKPLVSSSRIECPHCKGVGYMPGVNDVLLESVKLIGSRGDEVVRTFYTTLFQAAPGVADLFPGDPRSGDLGTDHRGAVQREKLLAALLALSDLYDPAVPAKMDRLDMALRTFGRSHAAFVRRDGTTQGATLEEYGAVKEAMMTTFVTMLADRWRPEYTQAWSRAYDYAAGVMIQEQTRSGFSAPRFPRA